MITKKRILIKVATLVPHHPVNLTVDYDWFSVSLVPHSGLLRENAFLSGGSAVFQIE